MYKTSDLLGLVKSFKYGQTSHINSTIIVADLHAKLHIKNYAVGVIAEAADSKFTSDMLEKLDSFEKASKDFKSLGATLVNMMEGCVKCALRFENLQNLFNFWIKYQLGEVSDFLTLRYVTDELRELEDGADLIVDVYIEEEEYSRVWDYYSSEGNFAKKPST